MVHRKLRGGASADLQLRRHPHRLRRLRTRPSAGPVNRSRALWTAGFLAVTATAVTMELVAANDSDPNTVPWTWLAVTYIPQPVTMAAIGVLVSWIGPHFLHAYRKKTDMANPDPLPQAPPLDKPQPKEPLLTVGTIVGVGAAAVAAAVAFGLPLTTAQQNVVLGLLAVLAPFLVA